jgi:anti-sigma regulatory factor (Ser/Thr protein kinase)
MGPLSAAPPRQQAERRNFTRNQHAPKFARAYVRLKLSEWHLSYLSDVVQLIADELVTNSVQHSDGENVMLWLVLTDTSIVVHAWDSNPEPPVARKAGKFDEDGRGLTLVTALTAQRGCFPYAGGKTIWAAVMR